MSEANAWQPSSTVAISGHTKTVSQVFTAVATQQILTLTEFTYVIGTGAVDLYLAGVKLLRGIHWTEFTPNSLWLITPATTGQVYEVVGRVGITGEVVVGVTDIYVQTAQALRDYIGGLDNVYLQGRYTLGDGYASFFEFRFGEALGYYVDDGVNVIVPTDGDGTSAWVRWEPSPLEFGTILEAKASKLPWWPHVGQSCTVLANNSTSGVGGCQYTVVNTNPGFLSTLVSGIWVGANHDLGGGYYLKRKTTSRVDVAEFGAVVDASSRDSTPAFIAAMAYVYQYGAAVVADWPCVRKAKLVGQAGDYYFSTSFITPTYASPNFVNYDIEMPYSTFKPFGVYNMNNALIHAKAVFDYKWEFGVSGFTGANVTNAGVDNYLIFNDSSRTQNWGGQCIYKIKAASSDRIIRHELESVVASFIGCSTNKDVKRFLRVWRCDQAVIDNCFFNWEQAGLSEYDSFIEWGKDDGATAEATFPGFGTYNVGRLNITNSFFIPNGTGVTRVHSGWIHNVSGCVSISGMCHFGPESNNRPSIVLNSSTGSTVSGEADIVESSIQIRGASCASGFDIVYCIDGYPNEIVIEDIRWNNLDYSDGEAPITYAIGGDYAVLNADARYSSANRAYFRIKTDIGNPSWKSLSVIDPRLTFANAIATFGKFSHGRASFNTLPSTNLYYDFANVGSAMPVVPLSGTYEVTNTYTIVSVGDAKTVVITSVYHVSIVQDGANAAFVVTPISVGAGMLGSLPALVPKFVDASNVESDTAPRADIDSGTHYALRIRYTSNLSGNTFTTEDFKMQRIS